MTVHFIGAGPGDPDLITVRGLRLITQSSLCLYAGSLVPKAVVAKAPGGARVLDTASMTLDDIIAEMASAHAHGLDIARVHSGDPSLYGAVAEQIRRLRALNIPYDITPGVSAYAAAAARLGIELTIPEVSQTVILTRTAMKSSGMPKGEDLISLGRTGATLAIHLSVRNLRAIERDLTPFYGVDCPVTVRKAVKGAKITRTALIFVGKSLHVEQHNFRDSALYDADHVHILRPVRGNQTKSDA